MGIAALQQTLHAGLQCHQAGQLAEAEALYRQVLAADPSNAAALHLMGLAAHQRGDHLAAIALVGQALQLDSSTADFHNTLGEAYRASGQLERAAHCYCKAVELDPAFAEAHSNLGTIHHSRGEASEAIREYERAIELRPDFPPGYYNLGVVLQDAQRLDQAMEFYQKALSLQPDLVEAHANLAKCLAESGRVEEALERYRMALRLRNQPAIHSSLLMNMLFDPQCDAKAVSQEHERWSALHAAEFMARIRPHENDPDPNRRLRIGYVSPDFRDHVVGYLFEPVLAHHDHERFEVTCYSNVARPDSWTARLQGHADRWRDITRSSDDEAAEMIRADGIDVLVDLALHLANNRLLVFARKPAPVQATYLGYAASTGLRTMDYRLTDPQMDPHGRAEPYQTEELAYLPHCYWCYRPHAESPPVIDPPALRRGWVTFGSTNSFAKVNRGVIEAWSAILKAAPDSRLLIIIPGGSAGNGHVHAAFASHGISSQRLILVDRCTLAEYLDLYQQIDVTLDPFPYNGGTTSLDSLWMGSPVVTLAGQRAVSRAGLTLLTNLGLTELVARTPDQYVQIATELAGDPARLRSLRQGLRERMRQSPLMDEAGFTRAMETAFRKMWSRWCREQSQRPAGQH